MKTPYSLVFRGEIALRHHPGEVRQRVRDLLKVSPEQLERVFSGEKVYIKKGLDFDTACRYRKAFEATGAICALEQELLQAEATPSSLIPPAETILCPKCGMKQAATEICSDCGVVIAKYQRVQENRQHGLPDQVEGSQDPALPAGLGKIGTGGLGAHIRLFFILALISVAGYAGYRYLAPTPDPNMVFTSNDCGDACQTALIHLRRAGVDFVECNIDASQENLDKFLKYGQGSVPLAVINGKTLIGYNQAAYQDMIYALQGKYLEESAGMVVIYTTRTCGYCRLAKNLLDDRGIEYTELDIADPRNRMRYDEIGGRGVPLLLINGTRINGFNQQVIIQELQKAELI